jgi:16S rRNA (guanine966-N2)-methyltransferase
VVIKTLAAQVDRLGGSQIEVIQSDYSRYLEQRPDIAPFDVVFIDPPFHRELVAPACQLLESGWLKPGARIYVETERPTLSAIPTGWHLLKSGRTGYSHGFLLENTRFSAEVCHPNNGSTCLS